jgi:hypothetical protein
MYLVYKNVSYLNEYTNSVPDGIGLPNRVGLRYLRPLHRSRTIDGVTPDVTNSNVTGQAGIARDGAARSTAMESRGFCELVPTPARPFSNTLACPSSRAASRSSVVRAVTCSRNAKLRGIGHSDRRFEDARSFHLPTFTSWSDHDLDSMEETERWCRCRTVLWLHVELFCLVLGLDNWFLDRLRLLPLPGSGWAPDSEHALGATRSRWP